MLIWYPACSAWQGKTWFTAPWFLVENYFYKRILELTNPVTGGADPFAAQKLASLTAASDAFARMRSLQLDSSDDLKALVMTSLWGNVADLSVSAGDVLVTPEKASSGERDGEDEMLLADESEELCASLVAARQGTTTWNPRKHMQAHEPSLFVYCCLRGHRLRVLVGEVIVVLDNCGLEFVADLVLIDGLLRCGQRKVSCHVRRTCLAILHWARCGAIA